MGPISPAERRLGLEYVNIAGHGVKEHLGRRLSDDLALVLFDKRNSGETIATLWSLRECRALTSETLKFGLGMLWDWDWRAEQVEMAFERLAPEPHQAVAP